MLTLLTLFFLHSPGAPTLAYLTPEEMFLQGQSQYYGPVGVALPINPRRAEWQAEADAAARQSAASSQAAAARAAVASSSSSSVPPSDRGHQGDQSNYWAPQDMGNSNLDPQTVRLLKRIEAQSHLQSMQSPQPPPSGSQPLASSGPGEDAAFCAIALAVGVTAYVAWKRKMRGMSF